ncbi:F-box/FBD/LRR-repeat protein At1g13570-like [Syzygium oleosum]|uniref:F-box/FBD/LRR-repeat protein At1g13570-like n=1 Tax=Syzygium oleosum TaxID=219896 RepID=UPI0011D1E7C8|nr:F-box/FBD/LRR-repeat protein At1g13570-like [Syzygium oleosum]
MMNELDKISHLPEHIMDQILSRLPIKDAVGTSILSRKWRYKWSSVPQLVFDEQCTRARGVPSLQQSLNENLVKIIDEVLLLHTGPIEKFMLSHTGFCATSNIDHWILHLSRVSIKAIVLHIWKGFDYKIPTSLFKCQDLIHLELHRCFVKIPSTFEGFKNLESLDLQHVDMSSNGLEALISCCPLLKRLNLCNLEGIKQINVEAGNLEWLLLRGGLRDVAFGIMNRLKSITVGFYDEIANKCIPGNANSSNLHKFFRNLPKIQSLKLENYSLKYLAIGNVPQPPPNELVHLNYLFTCIDFNSPEKILTVMCLIRSSPQLKCVDFQSRAENQQTTWIGTMANFWEDHQACCLEQVQVVSMGGIYGSKPEQEMMKFLLASSPKLQTMMIRPNSTSGEGKLFRELLRFRRASAQAEVIFLDPVDPEANPTLMWEDWVSSINQAPLMSHRSTKLHSFLRIQ